MVETSEPNTKSGTMGEKIQDLQVGSRTPSLGIIWAPEGDKEADGEEKIVREENLPELKKYMRLQIEKFAEFKVELI